MITGHFATALVPCARDRSLPLFALLLSSQAQDFLIPIDVLRSGQRDLARLEMTFSHDLLPTLVTALVVALFLQFAFRRRKVALVGAALVLLHEACDLLSGFAHNVLGPGTPRFGLDLYRNSPATASVIELVLALGCLGYFLLERRRQSDAVPPAKAVVLCAVILAPILGLLALALSGRPVF